MTSRLLPSPDFGAALAAMRAGEFVRRAGWPAGSALRLSGPWGESFSLVTLSDRLEADPRPEDLLALDWHIGTEALDESRLSVMRAQGDEIFRRHRPSATHTVTEGIAGYAVEPGHEKTPGEVVARLACLHAVLARFEAPLEDEVTTAILRAADRMARFVMTGKAEG